MLQNCSSCATSMYTERVRARQISKLDAETLRDTRDSHDHGLHCIQDGPTFRHAIPAIALSAGPYSAIDQTRQTSGAQASIKELRTRRCCTRGCMYTYAGIYHLPFHRVIPCKVQSWPPAHLYGYSVVIRISRFVRRLLSYALSIR